MAIFFMVPTSLPRRGVAVFLITTTLLSIGWRYVYIRIFSGNRFLNKTLLVGAGVTGQALLKIVSEMDLKLINIVSVVDDNKEVQGKKFHGYLVEGGCDQILEIIC